MHPFFLRTAVCTILPYVRTPPSLPGASPRRQTTTKNRPKQRSKSRNVLKGAKRIWPQAQKLLDRLAAAEATASRHGIRGPAESSDAWPLDGPFVDFELTPANEDAYYMQVAIRRAAAAARTRAEEEEREKEEERGKRKAGAVSGADSATGVGTGAAAAAEAEAAAAREVRVAAAVKAAVSVASSPAMLYTRGDMGDEESVLRDCLSVFRSDRVEKALRCVWGGVGMPMSGELKGRNALMLHTLPEASKRDPCMVLVAADQFGCV